MTSLETADAGLAPRRQCRICLKFFREMTDAQWRANAPYHVMSVRHQRAIQVRKSSLVANDPAVLRFQMLKFVQERQRSGRPDVLKVDLLKAFRVASAVIERQIEILEHRNLVDVNLVDEACAVRLTHRATAVIDAVDRDDQERAS